MNDIMFSALVVGIAAMIFATPFMMAKGILGLTEKLSIGKLLLCAIPIYNVIKAEKEYYGKIGLTTISFFTLIFSAVFRVFAWLKMYDNVTVGTVSIILIYGAILFYIIANIKFTYDVINDAGAMSGFKLFLFSVAFPFGQYFIGSSLSSVIRYNMQQEETFKG